ncbi:MAG: iron chelate uptake ABC transporter family permease subunit [Planctomycetaceae bacterium]|nr:iron chelate uptake ABC transporter family permease subunit [Planctomycetaceae bacterium]
MSRHPHLGRWALVLLALVLVERELGLLGVVASLIQHGRIEPWLQTVFVDFRLPRLVLAVLVGSGMAISGWTIQKAARNPMASPATVSVNEAAALGIVLALALSGGELLGSTLMPWIAAAAGTASALLLYSIVGRRRRLDGSGLLLCGIALGALWSAAGFAIALNAHPTTYEYALAWLVGSLSKATWDYVLLLFPAWWFLSLAAHLCASRIDVLGLEDPVVQVLGGFPDRWRRVALCAGAALAAACIGVSGSFGFLGFLAPALVRTLRMGSFATPWTSAVVGALVLLAADALGRQVMAPAEVPAGIVIAITGAPLFLLGLVAWRRVQPA